MKKLILCATLLTITPLLAAKEIEGITDKEKKVKTVTFNGKTLKKSVEDKIIDPMETALYKSDSNIELSYKSDLNEGKKTIINGYNISSRQNTHFSIKTKISEKHIDYIFKSQSELICFSFIPLFGKTLHNETIAQMLLNDNKIINGLILSVYSGRKKVRFQCGKGFKADLSVFDSKGPVIIKSPIVQFKEGLWIRTPTFTTIEPFEKSDTHIIKKITFLPKPYIYKDLDGGLMVSNTIFIKGNVDFKKNIVDL